MQAKLATIACQVKWMLSNILGTFENFLRAFLIHSTKTVDSLSSLLSYPLKNPRSNTYVKENRGFGLPSYIGG